MSATDQKITYTATPDQIEAMHDAFDAALASVESGFGTAYPLIIDGKERRDRPTCDVAR